MHMRLCTALTPRPEHNGLLHAALDIPRGLSSCTPRQNPLSPSRLLFASFTGFPGSRTTADARGNLPAVRARANARAPALKGMHRTRRFMYGHRSGRVNFTLFLEQSYRRPYVFIDRFHSRCSARNDTRHVRIRSTHCDRNKHSRPAESPSGCVSRIAIDWLLKDTEQSSPLHAQRLSPVAVSRWQSGSRLVSFTLEKAIQLLAI